MKLQAKIHTLKHFLYYAWNSKTKFKIHSPFVFQFIAQVLEKKMHSKSHLSQQLKDYYIKNYKEIDLSENAGAGSVANKKTTINTSSFISNVSVPFKYGQVLENCTQYCSTNKVLELGTSLGFSSSFLSKNGENEVVSIEANPSIYSKNVKAFQELGFKNINVRNGFFKTEIEQLIQEKEKFSFVFVDGDHNKKATLENFNSIIPLLEDNAVVVFDDIYWSSEMTEAWHEIRVDNRVKLSIDLFRFGLVFFRKEQLEKEDFILWY